MWVCAQYKPYLLSPIMYQSLPYGSVHGMNPVFSNNCVLIFVQCHHFLVAWFCTDNTLYLFSPTVCRQPVASWWHDSAQTMHSTCFLPLCVGNLSFLGGMILHRQCTLPVFSHCVSAACRFLVAWFCNTVSSSVWRSNRRDCRVSNSSSCCSTSFSSRFTDFSSLW